MSIIPQLIVNSLITGSIYALVAAGLALSYGVLRILNFAHGHLMMIGAYSFYLLSVQAQLGWIGSIVGTLVIALVFGSLSLSLFVRPFLRYSYHLPLVTTLALSTILESLVAMGFGVNVKSIASVGMESVQMGEVFITPIQLFIIGSAFVVLCLLAFVIHRTSVGRVVRALRENSYAAGSLGIREGRVMYGVFLFSTILAVYAGVLVGIETNIQPTMGNIYTLKALACMVLGGLGNVWGTIVGAYILGLVENFGVGLELFGMSLPAGYKDAFAFVIILAVLLVRPDGLFRRASRAV
jgi:branched-chain amino acid transport system permease protein